MLYVKVFFDAVLHVLKDILLRPWPEFIKPSLGMCRDHHFIGQKACGDRTDDVAGMTVVEFVLEAVSDLVAYAYPVSVPSSPRIGEIKRFAEIDIEVGFGDYSVVLVPELSPYHPVVPDGSGASVHTDGSDGVEIPEVFQVFLEIEPCLLEVTVGQ